MARWASAELRKLRHGNADLALVHLCMALTDSSDIRAYVRQVLGTTPQASAFASEFLKRKRAHASKKVPTQDRKKPVSTQSQYAVPAVATLSRATAVTTTTSTTAAATACPILAHKQRCARRDARIQELRRQNRHILKSKRDHFHLWKLYWASPQCTASIRRRKRVHAELETLTAKRKRVLTRRAFAAWAQEWLRGDADVWARVLSKRAAKAQTEQDAQAAREARDLLEAQEQAQKAQLEDPEKTEKIKKRAERKIRREEQQRRDSEARAQFWENERQFQEVRIKRMIEICCRDFVRQMAMRMKIRQESGRAAPKTTSTLLTLARVRSSQRTLNRLANGCRGLFARMYTDVIQKCVTLMAGAGTGFAGRRGVVLGFDEDEQKFAIKLEGKLKNTIKLVAAVSTSLSVLGQ